MYLIDLHYNEEENILWQDASVLGLHRGHFPKTITIEDNNGITELFTRILVDEDPNGDYNTVIYVADDETVPELHIYNTRG